MGYYLKDGIYSNWVTLTQLIGLPRNAKQVHSMSSRRCVKRCLTYLWCPTRSFSCYNQAPTQNEDYWIK